MALPHLYTRPDIEERAEHVLQRPGVFDHRVFRVDWEIHRRGFQIESVPGLSEIAEAYVPIVGRRIYIDEDQYCAANHRVRFTLAEELAHIVLHRPWFEKMKPEDIEKQCRDFTEKDYLRIERDAKYMAGCFLMRRSLFAPRFSHFFEMQRGDEQNDVKLLNFVVRQLIRDFNVSKACVAIRARDLKCIDSTDLEELLEFWNSG